MNGTSPPLCFLHVPKSAGTSIHVALQAAFAPDDLAPRRLDTSMFCDFDEFDRLDEPSRSLIAVDDSEVAALARFRVVSGHFSLPTLLRLAPPSNIATVLRDPRARLLSAYTFLRLDRIVEFWGPYGSEVLEGAARSLEGCFSDPRYARATDNEICRLVLHGDERLRDGEFVASSDVAGVAAATLERLDRLGSVQILEWDGLWDEMSRFFGVPLAPIRTNVTGTVEAAAGSLPIPEFDMRVVLDLIDQRNMADRLVYDTLLERRCGGREEARRIADAAFATQLVRFGDVTGAAATKLHAAASAGAADDG